MSNPSERVRLLQRRFRVRVPLHAAWQHLERVEQWPTWARHIRSIELTPAGPLGPTSKGTLHLAGGIKSTFEMEAIQYGSSWKWAGPFLWLRVHYDHKFRALDPDTTEIEFVLDGEGFGASVFGRVFAAVYARNLDKAIPNLIEELESARSGAPS